MQMELHQKKREKKGTSKIQPKQNIYFNEHHWKSDDHMHSEQIFL